MMDAEHLSFLFLSPGGLTPTLARRARGMFNTNAVGRMVVSTGSLPVVVGSLPTTIVFGKLPNTAGWQPALPGNDRR